MLALDMCYLSIVQAATDLRRKEFSPVELTQACLDRISALDGKLHAFITVTDELALSQARQAEEELLHGIAAPWDPCCPQGSVRYQGYQNYSPFSRAP